MPGDYWTLAEGRRGGSRNMATGQRMRRDGLLLYLYETRKTQRQRKMRWIKKQSTRTCKIRSLSFVKGWRRHARALVMDVLLWRSDMRTQRDEMYPPDRFSFLSFLVGFWDGRQHG